MATAAEQPAVVLVHSFLHVSAASCKCCKICMLLHSSYTLLLSLSPECHARAAQSVQACCVQPELQSYQEGCPSPYTIGILLALLVYLAVFAPGLGCVPWAVNSELFTPKVGPA